MKRREILAWLIAVGLLITLVWSYVPRTGPGDVIAGAIRVTDGDSMWVGETEIRLFGVDAFEGRQTCTRDGNLWPCGEAAADELRKLTARGEIACAKKDVDTYGRTVAVCKNGAVDLNAELARAGLALAYREYSDDYIDEEDEARAAHRGAWAGEFDAPWDFRRGRTARPQTQPQLPRPPQAGNGLGTCVDTGIKGNINEKGEHLYHVPGSRSYASVKINRPGERWFCTEEEARAAGWHSAN